MQTRISDAARLLSDLALSLQLSTGGQTLVETPPSPVAVEVGADPARIPLTAEFPLADFAPGRYRLKATLSDRRAGRAVSREVDFTVE